MISGALVGCQQPQDPEVQAALAPYKQGLIDQLNDPQTQQNFNNALQLRQQRVTNRQQVLGEIQQRVTAQINSVASPDSTPVDVLDGSEIGNTGTSANVDPVVPDTSSDDASTDQTF